MSNQGVGEVAPAARRLSLPDRLLPALIGAAMLVGLLLGCFLPRLSELLARMEVGGV